MAEFGLSQRLIAGQRQELQLQPRMLQSIEVLQLPMLELDSWLRQAVQENEMLRLVEHPRDQAGPAERRARKEATERHDRMLQNHPTPDKGLIERVEEQLVLVEFPPEVSRWVRFLVPCLDEAGFLSTDPLALLELGREEGLEGDEEILQRAISALQTLEPRGLGARNAVEALLLQIDPTDEDYGNIHALLFDFLEDVARNKLPRVAQAMGLEIEHLQGLIERLGSLNARPAAELVEDSAPIITPDVLVVPTATGFEVSIDSSSLPTVEIEGEVAAMTKDKSQPRDVREYLRGKLDRARWVVDAVKQRRATLLRISEAIFERQRSFLERGPGHLNPLRMNHLAEKLELHVSTISRAVAGKYAQTPFGILPLRHFFQSSAGADGGSARTDVREAVREVFTGEDASKPLSDDEVVSAMAERGWKLARRTVAKYRKELGIPSSYRRRKY